MGLLILLCLCTILTSSHASSSIEETPPLIHLLRPKSGSGGSGINGVSCISWRLAVETNNIHDWKRVPAECKDYVGHYMLGDLYVKDSKFVADEAVRFAQNIKLNGDGKDIWVFDVDETTLSNLPYYAQHGFGGSSDIGKAATLYKSGRRKELEDEGYRIVGNMGDQWSDILGTSIGNRTFKLPDPMYYIS
ncbi:hypothetical protein IFM89_007457 [Coptis chinensis]|uniref:Acid phosphatase n=1 Tax=Coptis chinensis TaxID=261450 RepID=A0A835IA25_9MAGN|nr:hypothetical protein IFM89_007457 [Coptis chinensis]